MSFQMTSFEEILNHFKLRNCGLNYKLCAKRKLSHSDVNTRFLCQKGNIKICDRATKLDSLGNFVPLYFSPTWTFLLPLLSGAVVVPENFLFQYFLKYSIGHWNCLFSGYNSRRIYKIIHVHMLSHKLEIIYTSILSSNCSKCQKFIFLLFDPNNRTKLLQFV